MAALVARESGKQPGKDFGVADNPEFLREGTSVFDFENPPYTVVGGSDDKIVQMLREMYAGVNAPFHAVRIREAEILKYACNAFHAVKVTFANEIGAISKKLGHRQPCGDEHLRGGHEAEHLALLSETRLRLRRLLSPEGCPRHHV